MAGNAPDEEHVDPHGECAHAIRGLQTQVDTLTALGQSRESQFTAAREQRDRQRNLLRDHIRPYFAKELEYQSSFGDAADDRAIEVCLTIINRIDEVLG